MLLTDIDSALKYCVSEVIAGSAWRCFPVMGLITKVDLLCGTSAAFLFTTATDKHFTDGRATAGRDGAGSYGVHGAPAPLVCQLPPARRLPCLRRRAGEPWRSASCDQLPCKGPPLRELELTVCPCLVPV